MKNNSTLPDDGNLDEKGLGPGKIDMIVGKSNPKSIIVTELPSDKSMLIVDDELLSLVRNDITLIRQLVQSDAESFARVVELMPDLVRVGILVSMKRLESLLAGGKNPSWEKVVDVSKLKSEVDTVIDVINTISTDKEGALVATEFGSGMKNILNKLDNKEKE